MTGDQAEAIVSTANFLLESQRYQLLATLVLVGVIIAGVIALLLHEGLKP